MVELHLSEQNHKKMKKRFLMACLVVFTGSLIAQDHGSIIYKVTRKLETPDVSDEEKQRFSSLMAGMNTAKRQLDFKGKESVYYDITGEQEMKSSDVDASGGERVMVFKVAKNEDIYYKNLAENKYTNFKDLFGKKFLIQEDLVKYPWKLINEQKEIAGYVCMKATAVNDKGQELTAWYTPSIPISNGPDEFGGLPGLIVALDENQKERYYELESIDLTKEVNIEKPGKGDKVSKKKYDEIADKKRKEMQEMYGGKGNMIMIRTDRQE